MKCKKWVKWVLWSRSMNMLPGAKWATVQGRVQRSAKLCKQCCIIMTVYHSKRTDPNVLLIYLLDSGAVCTSKAFISPGRIVGHVQTAYQIIVLPVCIYLWDYHRQHTSLPLLSHYLQHVASLMSTSWLITYHHFLCERKRRCTSSAYFTLLNVGLDYYCLHEKIKPVHEYNGLSHLLKENNHFSRYTCKCVWETSPCFH